MNLQKEILGTTIAEENVWFKTEFSTKALRDEAAMAAADRHRVYKERVRQEWLEECRAYLGSASALRVAYAEQAWETDGILFLTDKSKKELFEAADSAQLKYPANYHRIMNKM